MLGDSFIFFGKGGAKWYNLDIIGYRGFLQAVTVRENNIFKQNSKLCEFRETIYIYIHTQFINIYFLSTTNVFHDDDDDVEMMTCSDRRI